jgi:anti-sigma B factor antagonist
MCCDAVDDLLFGESPSDRIHRDVQQEPANHGGARSERGHKDFVPHNGPLDMETTLEFQKVVRAESSPVLIVDFGGVPYMDSAGLGAIVGAYVSAQKAQRRIALTGMNERLRALVELNRLSKILATYTSIAEAETALH